jgi:hypothetical protein
MVRLHAPFHFGESSGYRDRLSSAPKRQTRLEQAGAVTLCDTRERHTADELELVCGDYLIAKGLLPKNTRQ